MRAMPADSIAPRANAKPWWRSRTIWFNLIVGALGFADVAWGLLNSVLPIDTSPWVVLLLGVGNMLLRAFTNVALGSASQAGVEDVQ